MRTTTSEYRNSSQVARNPTKHRLSSPAPRHFDDAPRMITAYIQANQTAMSEFLGAQRSGASLGEQMRLLEVWRKTIYRLPD